MKKITLKNIIAAAILVCCANASSAQNGLECVSVEYYYVSDAADAASSVGTLPAGSVTYRIYADLLPGYKFQALYGVPGHTMTIQTSTLFFNNEDRGATTPSFTKAQSAGNTIMLDSWFSVGGACSNQMGIMKSEDDGVATVVNSDGILQNNDPLAGIPLTTQDGFIAGTPSSVTFVGFTTELDVFDATSSVGNIFTTSNGSIACLGGSMGPVPTTNKVLIGQFTTDGIFQFALNMQIGTPSGGVENYVAASPTGAEIMLSCLTFNSSLVTNTPEEIASAATVNIYPNPASDVLKIDVLNAAKSSNNSYKVYDVLGNVVAQKNIGEINGNYSEIIDITNYSNGMYFVELNINDAKSTKKIIKK